MSFPRYPQYKDSGVEWLGDVPESWKAVPLKAVVSHNDEVLDETTSPDCEIEYVDISSVDGVKGVTSTESMLFANAPSRARRRVKHGDVIVSTVRTYLRAIARISEPIENLIVSTGFAVIRPRKEVAPDFLGAVLSSSYFVEQVIARSTGVSYPAINASELVAIPVVLPPLAEQTAIAAFLDRETAKIDGLVGEQRRLIALLKEKRQAVISHAVTKGLNPHAPLKPSGIEWLGEVPEHWNVKAMRNVANVVRGASPRPAGDPLFFNGDAVPWVTVAEITKDDCIHLTDTEALLTELGATHSKLFARGTLIYSNSGATLGVPKILQIDACANDGVVAFETLSSDVDPVFLYHYLASIPSARLRAIEMLTQAGIPTRVMVAPIIPGLNDTEVPTILAAAKAAGAQAASYVLLRLPITVEPVFREWLIRTQPLKAEKIESLIRQTRDGKMYRSGWGERQRGTGRIAEQVRQMFQIFARKHELDRSLPAYDLSQFSPPKPFTGQLELF